MHCIDRKQPSLLEPQSHYYLCYSELQPVDKVHYVIFPPLLVVIHIDSPQTSAPLPPKITAPHVVQIYLLRMQHRTQNVNNAQLVQCLLLSDSIGHFEKSKRQSDSEMRAKTTATKRRWSETINKFASHKRIGRLLSAIVKFHLRCL